MSDKIIITHQGALRAKYGDAGLKRIRRAVSALVRADAGRRVTTRYVALDDANAMRRHGANAVARAGDRRAVKRAVDAIFAADAPDYLMILGSDDVVPHQRLRNPLHVSVNANGDEDEWIPSDLPYACDTPWSENAADFIAPGRVVGRLPDLRGASSPDYLLGLLAHATKPKRLRASGVRPFAVSAQAWQVSTDMTLRKLFGRGTRSSTSPAAGPQWTPDELGGTVHFINCHGASRDWRFFGDPGFPTAHDAEWIAHKVAAGTVAAAECCYGAELYDPKRAGGRQGIGQTYLACGATAYFGSTNIAYGPADANENADVICRFFVEEVLAGRSSGDATLTARQRYARASKPIDPYDLKTLAQFVLLGDPSIHPVSGGRAKRSTAASKRTSVARGTVVAKAAPRAAALPLGRTARKARRLAARRTAARLESSAPVSTVPTAMARDVVGRLTERLEQAGLPTTSVDFRSFATSIGAGPKRKSPRVDGQATTRVHVASTRAPVQSTNGAPRISYPVAVVAHERGGKFIKVKTLYGKSPAHADR